jgi:predicted methyltransferase
MKTVLTAAKACALAALVAWPMTATAKMDEATETKLKAVLAGDHRSPENKARDAYRHPLETLKFFGLRQDMTVLEIGPSGGWYTEVLAPLLNEKGKYVAAHSDPAASEGAKKQVDAFKAKLAARPDLYGNAVVGELSVRTGKLTPIAPGTADMVLTFRNIHNWMAQGTEDQMFKVFYDSLKPGGYLGVVEHRANTDKEQDPKAASGYVREDYAQALAEKAGFKLVAKSEVNANPKDTKDYPGGVWTLPPNFREKDVNREKYAAIGESDRFTHLYQKPAN